MSFWIHILRHISNAGVDYCCYSVLVVYHAMFTIARLIYYYVYCMVSNLSLSQWMHKHYLNVYIFVTSRITRNKNKNIYFRHSIHDIYIEVHRTINRIQGTGTNIADASYGYILTVCISPPYIKQFWDLKT